jgi:excisionase family DNA binding protein
MSSFGLLSSSEAAQFLGKSQHWVQVNRKRLGIPHYKIGGRYYFKQEELEAWLNLNHIEAQQIETPKGNPSRLKLAI